MTESNKVGSSGTGRRNGKGKVSSLGKEETRLI